MTAATGTMGERPSVAEGAVGFVRRNGWTLALFGLLVVVLAITKLLNPNYGPAGIQGLAIAILPIAFAAVAQAIVVISGGIDLSVGSMMALASVTSAVLMKDQGDLFGVGVVIGVLLLGVLVGAINGGLVVATKVPDIVVTLAMSFVWGGVALVILRTPGGGAPTDFQSLGTGTFVSTWIPAGVVVVALVLLAVWLPLRWRRPGFAIYAIGSNRERAYLSGVNVARTRVLAYAVGGFFAAMGGLAATATTGIGTPYAGNFITLNSVAAVVLGGVSLAGGKGGVVGPVAAAFCLTLVPSIMVFQGIDPNYGQVIQGALIVVVVMLGGLLLLRERK
jgi:ribose transport system permease protein